jgi:hypothetical protein
MRRNQCSHCKTWLAFDELFEDAQIGRPFTVCLTCKATNRHPTRTEWRMKKRTGKFHFVMCVIRDVLLFGSMPGLLLAGAVQWLFHFPIEGVVWFCVAGGTLIAGAIVLAKAKKKIEASNERMKDAVYLESLASLGLIRLKEKQVFHGRN